MDVREVQTSDRKRIGLVVAEADAYFLVECGTLRKKRHVLPKQLTRVDEPTGNLIVVMDKQLLSESPQVSDAAVGATELARIGDYWGLPLADLTSASSS
jgi:hypothetical protein